MVPPEKSQWNELRRRARDAAARAYAPYSYVRVGAAAVTETGEYVEGSNVENASFGLTLCAECSLVSDLVRVRGGRLLAITIVAGDGKPIAPCGRCRQVLFEHGGPQLMIDGGEDSTPWLLSELLPEAFGPEDLPKRRTP